jgi:hypothetical protein
MVTKITIGRDTLTLGSRSFVCVRDIRDWWVRVNPEDQLAGYRFIQYLEGESRRVGSPRLSDGTPDYCAMAQRFKQNNSTVRTIERKASLTKAHLAEPIPRYYESPKLKAWLDDTSTTPRG